MTENFLNPPDYEEKDTFKSDKLGVNYVIKDTTKFIAESLSGMKQEKKTQNSARLLDFQRLQNVPSNDN